MGDAVALDSVAPLSSAGGFTIRSRIAAGEEHPASLAAAETRTDAMSMTIPLVSPFVLAEYKRLALGRQTERMTSNRWVALRALRVSTSRDRRAEGRVGGRRGR